MKWRSEQQSKETEEKRSQFFFINNLFMMFHPDAVDCKLHTCACTMYVCQEPLKAEVRQNKIVFFLLSKNICESRYTSTYKSAFGMSRYYFWITCINRYNVRAYFRHCDAYDQSKWVRGTEYLIVFHFQFHGLDSTLIFYSSFGS